MKRRPVRRRCSPAPPCSARRRPPPAPGKPQRKNVKLGDNYYPPAKLTVNKGSTIKWRWPDEAIDVHDVKLKKGPKGVKKFHSEPGVERLHVQAHAEGAGHLQDRLHAPRGDDDDDHGLRLEQQLAFCAWNSASVRTPRSRRSASLARRSTSGSAPATAVTGAAGADGAARGCAPIAGEVSGHDCVAVEEAP